MEKEVQKQKKIQKRTKKSKKTITFITGNVN